MLIGAAVTLAILKIRKKFARKPKKTNEVDFKRESFSMQHDCGSCSADCMLRDSRVSKKCVDTASFSSADGSGS